MPNAGSLTFPGGTMYNFVAFATDVGWPMDAPDSVEEDLDTSGVNGRRWREIFQQHRPFTLSTLSECSDFNVAVNVSDDMRHSVRLQPFARLIARHPIRIEAFVNIKVRGVTPRPINGILAGGSANMGATIRALWVLESTGGFG
jgi:hypothetical protein